MSGDDSARLEDVHLAAAQRKVGLLEGHRWFSVEHRLPETPDAAVALAPIEVTVALHELLAAVGFEESHGGLVGIDGASQCDAALVLLWGREDVRDHVLDAGGGESLEVRLDRRLVFLPHSDRRVLEERAIARFTLAQRDFPSFALSDVQDRSLEGLLARSRLSDVRQVRTSPCLFSSRHSKSVTRPSASSLPHHLLPLARLGPVDDGGPSQHLPARAPEDLQEPRVRVEHLRTVLPRAEHPDLGVVEQVAVLLLTRLKGRLGAPHVGHVLDRRHDAERLAVQRRASRWARPAPGTARRSCA